MTTLTIKVSDEKYLRDVRRCVREMNNLDMMNIAKAALALAASYAPRKSGRLVASLRPKATRNRASLSAGSTAVPYAGPINYGWRRRHIKASEFMQRADRTLRTTAPKLLNQTIQKALSQNHMT